MNKEVSFPIAKLLNEKGIIFKTKLYYSSETKVTSVSYNEFAAPTIADVVMWFYEKHGIWISVGGDCDYKFKFEIHTWKWYEPEKSYRLGHTVLGETFWDCRSKEFSSPTEAYEAAFIHLLKNVI